MGHFQNSSSFFSSQKGNGEDSFLFLQSKSNFIFSEESLRQTVGHFFNQVVVIYTINPHQDCDYPGGHNEDDYANLNCGSETHQRGALMPSHCCYFTFMAPFLTQTFIKGLLTAHRAQSRLPCGHMLFITVSARRHHRPSAGRFASGSRRRLGRPSV